MTATDPLTSQEIEEVKVLYDADLPQPHLLEVELDRWYATAGLQVGANVTSALDKCDEDIFPNVHTLLQLLATIPATTCEAERSFSTLRRLNTYLRATQSPDRLDSLALINIHCGADINADQVIEAFARLHPRRMELRSLLNC